MDISLLFDTLIIYLYFSIYLWHENKRICLIHLYLKIFKQTDYWTQFFSQWLSQEKLTVTKPVAVRSRQNTLILINFYTISYLLLKRMSYDIHEEEARELWYRLRLASHKGIIWLRIKTAINISYLYLNQTKC